MTDLSYGVLLCSIHINTCAYKQCAYINIQIYMYIFAYINGSTYRNIYIQIYIKKNSYIIVLYDTSKSYTTCF